MNDWLWIPATLLIAGGLIYAWWVHLHSPRVAQRRGIQTVIDFRSGQDLEVEAEKKALARIGVHHRHLPTSIYPSQPEIAAFVFAMRQELNKPNRILIHCKDGEGRAVMFAAIYRIEFEGWDNERAYHASARLPDGLRFLNRIHPRIGCLSPRNVKTSLILNYRRTPMPAARGSGNDL